MSLNRFAFLLLFTALLAPTQAFATRTVTSPYVDKGVLKLKSKTGVTEDDERASRDGAWAQKFGAEYGFTERFSLEGEGDIENAGDENNTSATALSLKAKGLFTEKGKYCLDAGARVTYEANLNDGPDSAEVKFILAKDTDKFRHIANFIFDREVGDEAANDINGGFSWSSRYKWKKTIQPGFEMYNNLGSLSDRPDFEDQDHSIGPVFYGALNEHVKYEVGYLAGFTDNAADGRFKGILEYSLKF